MLRSRIRLATGLAAVALVLFVYFRRKGWI